MGSVAKLVALFLILLPFLFAAGLGCAAGGRNAGEACAQTADCRAELACLRNQCAPPGDCGSEGTACTATSDCCGIFTCQAGHCEVPGGRCGDGRCTAGETQATCCQDCGCSTGSMCRRDVGLCVKVTCGNGKCDAGETAATCCRDCRCAAGQVCQASKCVTKPVGPICGNHRCEAGETTATCCTDCGCAPGQACVANQCKAPTGTTLTLTLTHLCLNDEDVEFRLFDEESGVVWPGGDLVYVFSPGESMDVAIPCRAGETICVGGEQSIHGLTWGSNIDDSAFCTDCCFVCANQMESYSFECP